MNDTWALAATNVMMAVAGVSPLKAYCMEYMTIASRKSQLSVTYERVLAWRICELRDAPHENFVIKWTKNTGIALW